LKLSKKEEMLSERKKKPIKWLKQTVLSLITEFDFSRFVTQTAFIFASEPLVSLLAFLFLLFE
jgi:hypothetical protein